LSNQHGTQTIASQPSQFTWYIGWEGDPWALSLASGWFGCCWMSKNQLAKYHSGARIQVSNQHGTQTIASQPSQCELDRVRV
jgi:hypothetical protein